MGNIFKYRWCLRNFLHTIWFNFHYLPFKQAIKLPIVLYKPNIIASKGKIVINGPVRPFMIQLGRPLVYIYPNTGIMFENWGGVITFNGPCIIGNASALSVGEKGNLCIGENFKATTTLKLACYHKINIDKNVLVGWDCLIVDSDFHVLTNRKDGSLTTGYAPVLIKENTWIAMKCTILKGSVVPKYSILSACTLYAGVKDAKEYTVISSSVSPYSKIEGLYRNIENDKITYK